MVIIWGFELSISVLSKGYKLGCQYDIVCNDSFWVCAILTEVSTIATTVAMGQMRSSVTLGTAKSLKSLTIHIGEYMETVLIHNSTNKCLNIAC